MEQYGRGGRQRQQGHESIIERARKHAPASSQIIGFLALLITGGVSLFIGGLTVTGIVITLVLLTPVFLFFSPILVPAGIVLFLCVAGVLTAGGAGVATMSVLSWVYNHFKGQHPRGSNQVEGAEQVRQKARDVGAQAQSKAAPGA
ncbi:hypothetical protein GOP47_0025125 [Adiantum capillus-veneris]|uniref:Oleosin n=1 Tax=Adiantum capillus-veneris TaxID=13818 RepID=A0A9D4U433_ADICA|nr:hypothetical protein GOP47_0025125 [Adiantum capillus-veneris]